jgi:DNA polymerase-3 subunit epsilon
MAFFSRSPKWEDVVFWSLDLETSGLSPRRDTIIAAGAVPIRRGIIQYGERYSTLVAQADPARPPGEGLRAHHILPSELEEAPPLDAVIRELDRRMREGALLLHFSSLDLGFLRRAYRQLGMRWPKPPVVDTVHLLHRFQYYMERLQAHATPVRTALPEARAALALPAYPDHDALSDALATAELFLALRARLGARTLRELT